MTLPAQPQIAEQSGANGEPSVEAKEKTQQFLEYLTPETAIENAPLDCEEYDVEDVFGGKVRVRALTAAQAAQVRQSSLVIVGSNTEFVWAQMEMQQFRLGVIVPKFSKDQVRTLHLTSGRSFAKVIAKIDEISGINKEELRKAQQDFPGSDESDAV